MSSHIPQIKKPERPSGDTRVHQNQFVPILDQASKAYSTRRFSMIMSSMLWSAPGSKATGRERSRI